MKDKRKIIIHKTKPLKVWVDIDVGIYEIVKYLNTIKGVQTFSSCQGTLKEGGNAPYNPYVMIYCPPNKMKLIEKLYKIGQKGDGWMYIHPK